MTGRKSVMPPASKQAVRRTPTSGSKGKGPNLNSTLMCGTASSQNRARVNLNSTICSPLSMGNLPLLGFQDSGEFDCKHGYNEYIQALMKSHILKDSIESHKIVCNDQLEKYSETITKLKDEEFVQKTKIEEIEMNVKLYTDMKDVDNITRLTESVLHKGVNKDVDQLVTVLNVASNKLYLNNVEPLKNQDYAKFEALLKNAKELLVKFQNIVGDIEGVGKLSECITKNMAICEGIVHKNSIVNQLKDNVVAVTLEKTSDSLVSIEMSSLKI